MTYTKRRDRSSGAGRRLGALLVGALLVAGTGPLPAGQAAGAGTLPADGPGGTGGAPGATAPSQEACEPASTERIRTAYQRLERLVERRGSLSGDGNASRVDSLVADVVALNAASARIFGDDAWARLGSHRQDEFRRALIRYLRRELVALADGAGGGLPGLQASKQDEARAEDGGVAADYWVVRGNQTEPLTFHLATEPDGSCGIADVRASEEQLTGQIGSRVKKLWNDYSFPYMIAEIGDYGYVVLEDFERTPVGELPVGWTWKDKDDDSRKPYRVRSSNGNRYLEATDEGESVIIGREMKWNLNEYPLVSFRVRVNEIPEGADERYDDRVDSAAGIYFTVNKKMLGMIPESVKYVWSSTLPVGSAAIRDGIGRPWQVVFGTGKEGLGEWRTYYFDLKQAYRDTFGGNPPSKPLGVGILSDANSMNAKAYADYDDIRALRPEAVPPDVTVTSGVAQILETP